MTINELSLIVQNFGKNDKASQKNMKKQTWELVISWQSVVSSW